jgi:uncharacterized protein YneF (UPF0154 family)
MNPAKLAVVIAIGLFVGMAVCLEAGYRLGNYASRKTETAYSPTQNLARLLLPALNDMIDVTTSRTIALHTHLPPLIFGLSITVALLSGLMAGYNMAKRRSRSWFHVLLYSAAIAITIFTVVDLDYPRFGLIRLTAADTALTQLRDSIR